MLQKGDCAFFCHNGMGISDYDTAARQTIESLGLILFYYSGVTLAVRNSNLDREIRDDFYNAKVAVVLLCGKDQRGEGQSIGDNWAIPELKHVISYGRNCLVYATAEATDEEIESLDLPVDVRTVRDADHFAIALKQDLEQLMSLS